MAGPKSTQTRFMGVHVVTSIIHPYDRLSLHQQDFDDPTAQSELIFIQLSTKHS
jgi:hypothetical protein